MQVQNIVKISQSVKIVFCWLSESSLDTITWGVLILEFQMLAGMKMFYFKQEKFKRYRCLAAKSHFNQVKNMQSMFISPGKLPNLAVRLFWQMTAKSGSTTHNALQL